MTHKKEKIQIDLYHKLIIIQLSLIYECLKNDAVNCLCPQ